MVNSKGFQQVLRPWLESKITNSWLDPREAKSQDEFVRQYNVAWGMSQAADQILKFVDDKVAHAKFLEDKEDGLEQPIRVGE